MNLIPQALPVFLLGILLLAGCGSKKQESVPVTDKTLQVTAARAQQRTVAKSIYITGSLLPDESVNVVAEVAGRIARIHVDFGQPVRKGQLLVELDQRELNLRVERARGTLGQAFARLGLSPNATSANVASTPALEQARALLAEAQFKYESGKKLVESGDISRERFQEIERAYKQQKAGVESAEYDLRTQLAAIQSLEADVKLAEKSLSDAKIYAPFDGSVTERLVSPGQYLKENTVMMRLVKAWPLRLRVEVPESAAAAVAVGRDVIFHTDAIAGERFKATVRELNVQLDATSRTLMAEARVAKADERLRPGMFVRVELITDPESQIVTVPASSVYTIAGLNKLFVLEGGVAKERKVPPSNYRENGWVSVPADMVKPGDLVATSELPTLYEGMKVDVQERAATAELRETDAAKGSN